MTITRLALILPFAALAACDTAGMDPAPRPAPRTAPATVTTVAVEPAEAAAAEATTGVVAETLPAAPAKPAAAAGGRLGTTVASLGDATQGGMWIKTPLVKTAGKGRVVDPVTGKSVDVSLIPLGGAASAGSQLSLQAMTSLGFDPTELPSVDVYGA